MSLRSEIEANFIDGNKLVTPDPCPKGLQRGSDNGVCFTSEYMIYLLLNKESISFSDVNYYYTRILTCSLTPGLISRAPKDTALQPPDDYLAIAACCSQYEWTSIADEICRYGYRNWGCYDNADPNNGWNKDAFLWRQPQLLAAMNSAARRGKYNPFMKLLNFYAALCILVANINDDPEEVDGRRLTFLLIKAMSPTSILCRWASKVWKWHQEQTYGEDFMKTICSIYYTGVDGGLHPFSKYAKYE